MLNELQKSNDIRIYMAVLFISIGQMPFLVPMLDNANPRFALVKTTGNLHHIEVAYQDSKSGSL